MVERVARATASRVVPQNPNEDPLRNEARFRAGLEESLAELNARLEALEARLAEIEGS
jgi:hypothetical protein